MRKLIIAAFVFTGCSPLHRIGKEIKETENQMHDHVGFYLYDLSSQKVKLDHNGARYFTPASNTKIFTFYTSLRMLGDSIASIKYVRKNDSLIFQGLGDPSFLYENTFDNNRTFQFLKYHPGRLFFIANNFQTSALGPGWAWDDYNDYYSAERSALPLYGNIISIKKEEDKLVAMPAIFESNFVKSQEAHRSEEIVRDISSNRLTYYPSEKKSKEWTIPYHTSDSISIALLGDTLHRKVERYTGKLPDSARILKSIPVDSLYKVMMQQSDNFIAEQLLLQCAAIACDTLKPEIAISYSLKNLISDLPDKPQWVDGSGLSRFNLFTPRSIVMLWKKIYATVPQERLFKLLATGGKKGTLRNYYKADVPYVFGKTGSLSNVHTLSGFLVTRKGKIFIFSFMNNNFVTSGSDVRKRMEKIINQVREKY